MSDRWHACFVRTFGIDLFRCRVCNFEGTLREAIAHIVEQQVDA